MDQKIGVYICTGCGIGESIDVGALSAVANESTIAKCADHPIMCSQEGAGLIKADLESGEINCAVIAACSGRVKTDVFSFDPMTTIVERVNIREHVAWCQPPGHEDTQMMAEDYLRMGIIKVEKSTSSETVFGGNRPNLTSYRRWPRRFAGFFGRCSGRLFGYSRREGARIRGIHREMP